MNPLTVTAVYGGSFLLAMALLYFRHARWYWHVLSVIAALAIGLTPFPEEMRPHDLVTGFVFLFLLVWGLGELVVHPFHRHRVHHA